MSQRWDYNLGRYVSDGHGNTKKGSGRNGNHHKTKRKFPGMPKALAMALTRRNAMLAEAR